MANTKCSILREGAEINKQLDDAVLEAQIDEANLLGVEEINQLIQDNLLEKAIKVGKEKGIDVGEDTEEIEEAVRYLVGELVPEEKIDKVVKKNYGEAGDRYLLATKINALVNGNPIIGQMVHEMILQFMPSGNISSSTSQWVKGEQINVPNFAGINKNLTPEQQLLRTLKVQEIGTLKVIYNEALNMATAGTGESWAKGVIGKIVSKFYNPKEKGKTERSGAWMKFTSHATRYFNNIEKNIEYFLKDRKVKQPDGSQKTFKGMDNVLRDVNTLSEKVNIKVHKNDLRTKGELFTEFFVMNMTGEIYFDKKTNKFMIHQDYGPLRDADNKVRLWPDETIMHGFSNPIELSKYRNGLYSVKFKTKSQFNSFTKLKNDATKVNERVFKETRKNYENSVKLLKKAIKKHFVGLPDAQIELLFFEDWKVKQHKELLNELKDLDKKTGTKYINTYNLFKDTFGNIASVNLYLNRVNESQGKGQRKHYWPTIYPIQTMTIMWDSYIVDMQRELKIAKDNLENFRKGEYDKLIAKKKLNRKEFKKDLKKEVAKYNSIVDRAIEIKDNRENKYKEDTLSAREIPFARDHRHLKSITNAFDIRLGRKDGAVYRDYLMQIMSSIERNLFTVSLLDSINIAQSDVVVRALVNYYKVPFADPSVEGGIITSSDESVSAMLNKVGIKISPEILNRFNRRINKWLTASKLGGISTSILNRSAIVHNILDRNRQETSRAKQVLSNNREEVEEFLTKINIAAFQDFFSSNLINGKAGIELDNATIGKIYMIMLNYPESKQRFKNMGISKLKDFLIKNKVSETKIKAWAKDKKALNILSEKASAIQMQKEFSKVLELSPMYNLKIKSIMSQNASKERLKIIAQSKKDTMLNKFVGFAITQEYELNRYANMFNWQWTLPSKIYKSTGDWFSFLGSVRKSVKMTMSDSEAYIRSISAISGILKAQELGFLRNDINFWEFQGKDLEAASEIGNLLADFTNMGLSTTDMAQIGWGGFGSIQQKFNIWAHQRRGREANIAKYAYIAAQELKDLGQTKFFDGKALSKMILQAVKGNLPFVGERLNTMNATQKHQAHLMKFIYTGVMPAVLLDLVIWGPLGNIAGFALLNRVVRVAGFEQVLKGLPSANARLLSLPIGLAIKFALGMLDGDDEEEELGNFFRYYLRELPGTGFGISWSFDQILLLYHIFSENNVEAVKVGVDAVIGPISPLPTVTKTIRGAAIQAIDD